MGSRAEEEGFAGYGRGRHEAVTELVFSELFEFAIGGDDRSLAFFAEEIDPPFGCNRCGGVIAANTFVPNDMTGFGFPAGGDAVVVYAEEEISQQQK